MGWLTWNLMRLLALVGFTLVTITFLAFVWFMIEVGFAWVAIAIIGLVALLVFFSVKNRGTGFDIRR
jgi:hypothetical protein